MRRLPLLLLLLIVPASASAQVRDLDSIPAAWIPSGFLLDRSLPLSDPAGLDGRADARSVGPAEWRQLLFQLPGGSAPALAARAAASGRGVIPIGLLDLAYDRLAPTIAKADGSVAIAREDITSHRLFSASALRARVHGTRATFRLDERWTRIEGPQPSRIEIDFDDGRGFRTIEWGVDIPVDFLRTGRHFVRLRATSALGVRHAAFRFDVQKMMAPAPDDTLDVDATIPWNGASAGAEAFVYLAPGHTQLTQPALVVEGFDLDDSMNWPELYALLNDENLIEDLRAEGFDAVVLNFDNATDAIQRNAMTVVEMIQQVRALVGPDVALPLIGASMGGLCSRYALAYMEDQPLDHGVVTFISFDTPHGGANIPLGIQHWLAFFRTQSAEADFLLSRLDTPASRQMLLLHHSATAGSATGPDALRSAFLADLAALGDWPSSPRLVGVGNGSGTGANQGFAAAQQIIRYNYDTLLIDIIGNVWALGDGSVTTVFQGKQFIFLILNQNKTVSVGPTRSWDNAPGGWRNSMAQMDSTEAPYGDIVASFENHAFIPTVSALALDTDDPFFDIAGAPDLLALSAFDAVYVPTENQPHVDVTPENRIWFLDEVLGVRTVAAPTPTRDGLTLHPARPNPFNPATVLRFDLPRAAEVSIDVYDARGRWVSEVLRRWTLAGSHQVLWRPDGLASGNYLIRVQADGTSGVERVVLLK